MQSMAERIAARKAAALAEQSSSPASPSPVQQPVQPAAPAAISPGLAAILAKRAAAAQSSNTVSLELPKQVAAPIPAPAPTPVQPKAEPVAETVQVAIVQEAEPETDDNESLMQQHYADIKARIDSLTSLSLEDTVTAMSKLKAALKANPAACSLMLDEDLGLMTIALRRITQSQMVEAEEEKATKGKKPKAAKMLPLTQEQIEAAWAEL